MGEIRKFRRHARLSDHEIRDMLEHQIEQLQISDVDHDLTLALCASVVIRLADKINALEKQLSGFPLKPDVL